MSVKIMVNQVGYISTLPKNATVVGKAKRFTIRDAQTNEIVYKSTLSPAVKDAASSDRTMSADFSEFYEVGKYYIAVGKTRSAEFEISTIPYGALLDDVRKSMYYSRCGCALHRIRAGAFRRKTCHIEPATLFSDQTIILDVSGGWHDAGDYSRCTVTAALSLAYMLYAYEFFPAVLKDANGISDMGRICPALIEECQYELEWLLKMQDKDGGVFHKVSSKEYAEYVMPCDDKRRQYVFEKTLSATIAFAAVVALAARIFEPMGLRIIKKLRPAALAAWAWILNNPDGKPFRNPDKIKSPEYSDPCLDDDMFWAATELYNITGGESFSQKIEELYDKIDTTGFTLHSMGGFGAIAYVFSPRDKNPDVLDKLRGSVIFRADSICSVAKHSGYRCALEKKEYVWGSNLTVLANSVTLIAANIMEPNMEYLSCVLDQINYLLGNNPLGRSYITGYGTNCVKHLHYRPTIADGIDETIPGFVASGPDSLRRDEYSKWLIPVGTPPAKCHIDMEHSYSTNETGIYFNAAAIFVLGYLAGLCEGIQEAAEEGEVL